MRYSFRKNILVGAGLAFLMITTSGNLEAAGNSAADLADIEKRHAWTHDFPTRVIKTEILQGTYLAVTTLPESKKDPQGRTVWLVDGKAGKILWSGPEAGVYIVAGDPYPVVVQQTSNKLTIEAFDRAGKSVWKNTTPTTSLSISMDETNKELVLLESEKIWFESEGKTNVTLRALSPRNGQNLWSLNLGEFSLPKVVPSNVMRTTMDSVWIVLGGEAMRISRSNQQIFFRNKLKLDAGEEVLMDTLLWDITNSGTSLVYNLHVLYLDPEKGVQWSWMLDQKKFGPDNTALDKDVVVASFLKLGTERPPFIVVGLSRSTGDELWRYEARDATFAKFDRVQRPPKGLLAGHGKVVFSMKRQIIWMDAQTGEVFNLVKLKKKEYINIEEVSRYKDSVVVNGKFQFRVYDLATGKLKWHQKDLATPEGREIVSRRIGAALSAGAFAFSNSLAEWQAQSMKQLADTKLPGRTRYDKSYSDYMFSPSARSQMQSAAFGQERSAAWMKVAESVTKLGPADKFITRVQDDIQNGTLIRSKLKGKNGAFASLATSNLALVDMETGEFSVVPTPKVGIGCISAISADLDGDRLYHGYHQGGLGCQKATHRLDAFYLR